MTNKINSVPGLPFIDSKWNQSGWTDKEKCKWQEEAFRLGYQWLGPWETQHIPNTNFNFVFLTRSKLISGSNSVNYFLNVLPPEFYWQNMFPNTLPVSEQNPARNSFKGTATKIVNEEFSKVAAAAQKHMEEVLHIPPMDNQVTYDDMVRLGIEMSNELEKKKKDKISGQQQHELIQPADSRIDYTEESLPFETDATLEQHLKSKPKYDVTIIGKYGTGSCVVDVYRVLAAFKVVSPQQQHSIIKELKLGDNDERQDLVDIRDSAQSALDMFDDMESPDGKSNS